MAGNLYFFTGEDEFRLEQELERWVSGFREKHGPDSVFVFGAERRDAEQALGAVFGGGLFSEKKMVVLRDLPPAATALIPNSMTEKFLEQFEAMVGNLSGDTWVIFVATKPDKRKKFFKFLDKTAEVKKFAEMKLPERKKFVQNFWENSGVGASPAVVAWLAERFVDSRRLVSEMEKVLLFCRAENLAAVQIEKLSELCFTPLTDNVFAFLDALIEGQDAVEARQKLAENRGNLDPFAVLGGLGRGAKALAVAVDALGSGWTDMRELASAMKYSPFFFFKIQKNSRAVLARAEFFRDFLGLVWGLEIGLKSGKISPELFRVTAQAGLAKMQNLVAVGK